MMKTPKDCLPVLRQQHQAIDMLMARVAQLDPEFMPSQSGPIWDAVQAGHWAIKALETQP